MSQIVYPLKKIPLTAAFVQQNITHMDRTVYKIVVSKREIRLYHDGVYVARGITSIRKIWNARFWNTLRDMKAGTLKSGLQITLYHFEAKNDEFDY